VLGLGYHKVQEVLGRHGVTRVLAREGGRTSRGSLANMAAYCSLLNWLHAHRGLVGADLEEVEAFWIGRVNEFFSAKPFSLRLDSHLSLRAVIRNLMAQAEARQKETPGTMFVGTMMQHIIGAKLEIVMDGRVVIQHHPANENDESGRGGDFDIGDVAIHVTTSPGEALLQKCTDNLANQRRPIIVTTSRGAVAAEVHAERAGILDRVDIVEFEQFIAANLHEWGGFQSQQHRPCVIELIQRYNCIVQEQEALPGLEIELPMAW
jgi:hypothetical protein